MDNIVQVSTVSPQILAATLHVLISYIVHALHKGEKVREEKKGNSPFLHLFPSLLPSFSSSPSLLLLVLEARPNQAQYRLLSVLCKRETLQTAVQDKVQV